MKTRCLLFLTTLLICNPARGQDTKSAATLDELLGLVKEGRSTEQRLHQKREAEFRAARDQQQELLQDARKERAAQERQSQQLEKKYDASELKIADVTDQLDRRLGSLKELFGVLQQVTGDTQGLLESSLTSAQFPDRTKFLVELNGKLTSTATLPSIEEIERLWFLLQQEMTETGKVVQFPAVVITTDGSEVKQDVVRIGGFNIVSKGKYLQYTPETGNLSELGRQPPGRFTKTATNLFEGQNDAVVFGVDPTRGQILATYLDRPGFSERLRQGGMIGYIIIGLGAIGILIALERLISLGLASRKVSAQLKNSVASSDNPLGRVLQVAEQHKNADVETLELKLEEAVLKETPKLTRTLLFIKIIGVVAPLMGLLGTVTGMIVTFQAITLFGTGDPKLMAGGISQALMTTVLGLAVAIPIVLLHTLVFGRSKRILHILEQQSAGILAERSGQGA